MKDASRKEKKQMDLRFKYSKKERALVSGLTSFLVSFIFILFGSLDIYANNFNEYLFSLSDFILPLLLVFVLCFIALFGLFFLFKGRGLNTITAVVISIMITCYFDIFVLSKVDYEQMPFGDALGFYYPFIFFVIVFSVLYFLALALNRKWKNIAIYFSILFIVMNMVSLITDFTKVDMFADKTENLYVESRKGEFEVSSKENIVYFLFDRFDTDYYYEVVEDDPTYFEGLDGFTFYSNHISRFHRSFPSIAYMITDIAYDGSVTPQEYLNSCYSDSVFLKDLANNGYQIGLYSSKYYTYDNAINFEDVACNIEPVEGVEVNTKKVVSYLINLSILRNNSYMLEAEMAQDANSARIQGLVEIQCEDTFCKDDDTYLYDYINENGLTVSDADKRYIFIHLVGSHSPFLVDENCQPSEEATSLSQTKGSFAVVKAYLAELKRLGVYDNSTIIISGDHGIPYTDMVTISEWENYPWGEHPVTTSLFFKPRQASSENLTVSDAPVQAANVIPSIVDDAQLSTDYHYTYSLSDIENGATQTREYDFIHHTTTNRKIVFDHYEVGDDATQFSEWKLISSYPSNQTWY